MSRSRLLAIVSSGILMGAAGEARADTLIVKSNQGDCTWWVDGAQVATGTKTLEVEVSDQPHVVVAEPAGYAKKLLVTSPPFGPSAVKTITFMVQDRVTAP